MEHCNPIKIGMLGLGRAGNGMHRPELSSRTDRFQIYAVCDEIPERCDIFVKECGAKKYLSYEEMLADPEISSSTLQRGLATITVTQRWRCKPVKMSCWKSRFAVRPQRHRN